MQPVVMGLYTALMLALPILTVAFVVWARVLVWFGYTAWYRNWPIRGMRFRRQIAERAYRNQDVRLVGDVSLWLTSSDRGRAFMRRHAVLMGSYDTRYGGYPYSREVDSDVLDYRMFHDWHPTWRTTERPSWAAYAILHWLINDPDWDTLVTAIQVDLSPTELISYVDGTSAMDYETLAVLAAFNIDTFAAADA